MNEWLLASYEHKTDKLTKTFFACQDSLKDIETIRMLNVKHKLKHKYNDKEWLKHGPDRTNGPVDKLYAHALVCELDYRYVG